MRRVNLGEYIKAARVDAGMSVPDLAMLIGCSAPTVYRWEQGKQKVEGENQERLIEVLNLDRDEFYRLLRLRPVVEFPRQDTATAADSEGLSDQELLRAIRSNPRLLPHLRDHLANQFQILLEASAAVKPSTSGDLLAEPHAARKRVPPRKRS